MSANKESNLSSNDLNQLLQKNEQEIKKLDKTGLAQLKKLIKQIVKAQKEKGSDSPNEDIIAMLSSDDFDLADLQKSLEAYKTITKDLNVKKKISKFRQSGHLIDQTLKYTDPKKNQQLSLFDLLEETKNKILESNIEVKAQGIRLEPSEDKLVKALCKLLQEKNTNLVLDPEEEDKKNTRLCPYGGRQQEAKAPILRLIPAELYKAYLDKNDYSGDEIRFIKKTLQELAHKRYLISYNRKREENGKTVTDRIEEFQTLVKIMTYAEGLSEEELRKYEEGDAKIREKKEELIIGLNPIFIDQIDKKYIEYPSDVNKRTTIAAGGYNYVTESMIVLRDFLLRELSANRDKVEINEEKLPYLLRLDGYIKRRKPKIVAERIEGAIRTVKHMGIITGFEKVIGAQGQLKYVFNLNVDFE